MTFILTTSANPLLLLLLLTFSLCVAAKEVDLGYAIYKPNPNPPADNYITYNGIRYGSASRFGHPHEPKLDRHVQVADDVGTACYQILPNRTIAGVDRQSEDCLLLDVWIPTEHHANKDSLPVVFNIHGGAYQYLSKNAFNPSTFARYSPSPFIYVSINYRLGAFGFLASKDYKENGGVLNAGLRDQQLALKWVQKHIHKFGGDAKQVAIFGESAGAGSVLQQSIASGNEGLFQRVVAASPYLPPQPKSGSPLHNDYYQQLAIEAGCSDSHHHHHHHSTFECLKTVDAKTLDAAQTRLSNDLLTTGTPQFVPCTDGEFISDYPTTLLAKKKVPHGTSSLIGTNINEGAILVPAPNITTAKQVRHYAKGIWQGFDEKTIDQLLELYPSPKMSTIYSSQAGRLAEMYSDAIFRCPANLFAGAFTRGHRYQFGIPPSTHALDLNYYFPEQTVYADDHFPTLHPVQKRFVGALSTFMVLGKFPVGNARKEAAYDTNTNHFMSSFESKEVTDTRPFNFTNVILPAEYKGKGEKVTRVSTRFVSPSGQDLCSFWDRHFPQYWPE
jgi:carboxylesterase type B